MKRIILLLLTLVAFGSCSEYQQAVKSKDNKTHYEVGKKMYEKEKYAKAIVLFNALGTSYRAKPEGDPMYYMLAHSYYNQKQYMLASYSFGILISNFPKSDKIEEASFMVAKCHYNLSAKYTLDQADTHKAVDKLQSFIDRFPDSKYLVESNEMMKILTQKLEKKSFEIAKQYNTISRYKAAIKALDIFMYDNPGSIYREESLYLKLDSGYKLAINSIESKKEERLLKAKKYYAALIAFKKDTEFKKDADNMLASIEKELKLYTN